MINNFKEIIEHSFKRLTDDSEINHYVLLSTMQKLNISVEDPHAYDYLRLFLCEEVDIMIDELEATHFDEEKSELIEKIETIQNEIFNQSYY
jgi:hypothetical protein